MSREMISGPDLGGGFLFQLTVDRDVSPAEFVFHAQPGGMDANGPPEGSPEPLGYERADGLCPLGGRLCWHRTFRTEPTESLRVRYAYNRTRLMMATRIHRAYAPAGGDFEPGLVEFLARVEEETRTDGFPWAFGGATAEWVERGGEPPTTIRVESTESGTDRLGQSLGAYLIEPVARTSWPPHQTVRGARAFVGAVTGGVDVEWRALAGFGVPGPGGAMIPFDWKGHSVQLWKGPTA